MKELYQNVNPAKPMWVESYNYLFTFNLSLSAPAREFQTKIILDKNK